VADVCEGSDSSRTEQGFVLPLVLVTIGVISLALWAAISVIEASQNDIVRLRERVELEKAALTAEARAIFLLATEPLGAVGLRVGEQRYTIEQELARTQDQGSRDQSARDPFAIRPGTLRLDSRPYRVELPDGSTILVEIQDEAGLFNVNVQDPLAIERLLVAADVEEKTARSLADALVDFVDQDDLKRLNGAEAPEYSRAGLPPPANRWLVSNTEAFGAFGWASALDATRRSRLAELSTAFGVTTPFNINTAPKPVLQAWFGLDAEGAAKVVREREARMLAGSRSITLLTGQPVAEQDFRLYAFPANRFRIRVYRPGSADRDYIESAVRLPMQNAERPFYFDLSAAKTFPVGLSRSVTDNAKVTPLVRSPHLLGD
jgi:hypothetical protein